MEKYFYVRVSTKHQEVERQLLKARELGIKEENIYVDKQSGKDLEREQYQLMRSKFKEGDLLYLDALDRLGRNYDLITEEWVEITRKIGIDCVVLESEHLFNTINFKKMGKMGRMQEDIMLATLAFVADTEREKMLARQREGIAIAKAQNKYKGRKPKYTEEHDGLMHAVELYKEGTKTVKEIINITKISRSSFYEYLKANNITK